MHNIEGILLEPVGCLAEFPPGPFHEISVRFFARKGGRKGKASKSGSRSYWHLLNLIGHAPPPLDIATEIETLEIEAVVAAHFYEDVEPALAELKAMGVTLCIASSLSQVAINRFLQPLPAFFSGVWSRDTAGGIKEGPLLAALRGSGLNPESTIFLTDTAEGLKVAQRVGVRPVLMMNDPDEARRLSMPSSSGPGPSAQGPAGGIVSLHELPDFVRLVQAQNVRAQNVQAQSVQARNANPERSF